MRQGTASTSHVVVQTREEVISMLLMKVSMVLLLLITGALRLRPTGALDSEVDRRPLFPSPQHEVEVEACSGDAEDEP